MESEATPGQNALAGVPSDGLDGSGRIDLVPVTEAASRDLSSAARDRAGRAFQPLLPPVVVVAVALRVGLPAAARDAAAGRAGGLPRHVSPGAAEALRSARNHAQVYRLSTCTISVVLSEEMPLQRVRSSMASRSGLIPSTPSTKTGTA